MLLSATGQIDHTTIIHIADAAVGISPAAVSAPFTPAEMQSAYGVNAISLNGGAGNGSGQTIAIIDAFDDPYIVSDTAAFNTQYGLPQFNVSGGPTLTILNQTGGTSLPSNSTTSDDWSAEESLDVQWAHAIAPQANIIVFEANSDNSTDLYADVATAAAYAGVSVVSMSWGGPEYNTETGDDATFTTPSGHQGVTFLAATGDSGAPSLYPAYSPNVIAVGGTTLTINNDGSYGGEVGWSKGGGGISQYESQPPYQTGKVNGTSATMRTAPDVSIDADPNSGVNIYDSDNNNGGLSGVWGGTSLACPMWAGLIAIANQGRVENGLGTFDGRSQTLPTLYKLSVADFHDVTTGNNGYAAGPGYDLVTGIGSPIANLLVPALVSSNHLAFGVQPTTVTAGGTITPAVTVDIEYGNNTIITTDNAAVTLSVYGATLDGTTTVNAVNGVATFTNLDMTAAGNWTLMAADNSDAGATSNVFTVLPGAAAMLGFAQQPGNTGPGQAIAPAVTVDVLDAYGNAQTSDFSTVSMALASGPNGAVLSGTLTAQALHGVAAFGNLSLNLLGNYTLLAADGSLSGAISVGFMVFGPPARLMFDWQPTNTLVNYPINPAITVDVLDANGYLVSTDSSLVSLSVASGPGTLSGTVTVAAINGVATFINASLTTAGNYTLSVTDGSLTAATSNRFNISAAAMMYITDEEGGTIGQYTTAGAAVNSALVYTDTGSPTCVAVSGTDLFFTDEINGTVSEYTTAGVDVNDSLILGLNTPLGIIVSGSDLFIANSGDGTVGEYTTSGAVVNATLVSGLIAPADMALSGSDLFVTDNGDFVGDDGSISEYTTSGQIVNAGLVADAGMPFGIVLYGSDMFVVNQLTSAIDEYTTAGATVATSLISGFNLPDCIAIFGSDLFVTDEGGFGTRPKVAEYTTSGVVVNKNLIKGVGDPVGICIPQSAPTQVPGRLAFAQQPGSATAGNAISPTVTVNVEDANGNLLTSDNSNVTLSLAGGPGALYGNLTVAAVNGVATFSNLVLSQPGNYTLQAADSSYGLSGFVSGNFTVNPAWLDPASGAAAWNAGTQTLTVTGKATITVNPGTFGDAPNISLGGNASLVVNTGSNGMVINIGSLSLQSGATFDVGTNIIIVGNTTADPVNTIQSYIFSKQIISSSLTSGYAVGYGNVSIGNATYTEFRYTIKGDADLNGKVSLNDVSLVLNNYGQSTTQWSLGNFEYNSAYPALNASVNVNDLSDVLGHFGGAVAIGSIVAAARVSAPTAAVSHATTDNVNDSPLVLTPLANTLLNGDDNDTLESVNV